MLPSEAPSQLKLIPSRGRVGGTLQNRINPRVVKKKMSNFGKKKPEHYHPLQPQSPFPQSVVILK